MEHLNHQAKSRGTRVLIVDDHPVIRESLARIVWREPDLAVCGEAEDRNQALEIAEKTDPHLAMVDLTLENSSGLELVKDLRVRFPKLRVLVFSMHDEMLLAARIIRAGAHGYISKQERPAKILQAIRRVLSGEIYWSEKAAASVASQIAAGSRSGGCLPEEVLTDRELQVFRLISVGRSTKQIAGSLQIGVTTVETYRSRIKEKLNLKSAAELLQFAIGTLNGHGVNGLSSI
ncbi:MAG: response regulator transcription factor [Verrucomicrobiota bacterium]|nr:response regulator transcription factor [Verrucomicrobiota bacterium]